MLRWFGHVEIINIGPLTAQIYGAKVDGGVERGRLRPRRSFLDEFGDVP